MPDPVLLACGHGTRDPAGRAALTRLRLDVAGSRPGLEVRAASIDVEEPSLGEALDRLAAEERASVVVPLLLSAGYHAHVDVVEAVAAHPAPIRAAPPLGPDPVLVDVLSERLAEAGVERRDPVVLAAAGSSDSRATDDVAAMVRALRAEREGPVLAGYLSATRPTVVQAVMALGGPVEVAVATYLLAPGVFTHRLDGVARRVTAPLAPHRRLAELVLRRYDSALAG